MAHDQPSGLQNFVKQKNIGQKQNGQPAQSVKKAQSQDDLQDLRVPMKGKKAVASNTPATREPGCRRTRSTSKQDHHIDHDTDFSEADRTTTASGTKRSHSYGAPVQAAREVPPPQHDDYEQMTERPEYEAGSDAPVHEHDQSSEHYDFPDDPLKQPWPHDSNTQDANGRAKGHPGHNAFTHQQIKGDSYPPTTAGDPSVSERPDHPPEYSTQPPENNYPVKSAGAMPTRGAGTRLQSARPPHPQSHNTQAEPAVRNPAMPFSMPSSVNNVVNEANVGFSFKPGNPRTAPPPQHSAPPQVRQAPTTVAHRGSPPVTNLSSRQDGRQRLVPANAPSVTAQPQEAQRLMKRPPHRQSTHPQPVPPAEQVPSPPTRAVPAQRHEPTSRTAEHGDLPAVDNHQHNKLSHGPYDGEEPAEEEVDEEADDEPDDEPDYLDYEIEEIYAMDYAQLKDESFDVDPQADELQLPEVQEQDVLEAKLQTVSTLPGQAQMEFYKSLPVEQWEEAGDWFLDQFGAVLNKFRAARQAKRKLARQFEDEIEKRHEAVSKKRKLTEDALGEMRKTGSVVLAGTPKKSKKTK